MSRRLLSLCFMVLMLAVGSFFFGCGDPYSKVKISVNTDDVITLNIDNQGNAQEKEITVKVSNMPKVGTTDLVSIETNYPSVAYVDKDRLNYNATTGETTFTLVAKSGGPAKLTLVAEGGVTKVISILVNESLSSISPRDNNPVAIIRGESYTPDYNKIVFMPATASNRLINYELRYASNNANVPGVYFNNGVLSALATSGLSSDTSYKIVARSAENSSLICEIPVVVVDKIDVSKVVVTRADLQNFEITNGIISLATNVPALGTALIDVNVTGLNTSDLTINYVDPPNKLVYTPSRVSSNRFKIEKQNKGSLELEIKIGYKNSFDFYNVSVKFVVDVIDEPANISLNSVNGTSTDVANIFTGSTTIYNLLEDVGPQPLLFKVEPATAKYRELELLIKESDFYDAVSGAPKVDFTEKSGSSYIPVEFKKRTQGGESFFVLTLDSIKTIYANKNKYATQDYVLPAVIVSTRNAVTLNLTIHTKTHATLTNISPNPLSIEKGDRVAVSFAPVGDISNLTFISSNNNIAQVAYVDYFNNLVYVDGINEGEFTLSALNDGIYIGSSILGNCFVALAPGDFKIELQDPENSAIISYVNDGNFLSEISIDNTPNASSIDFAVYNANTKKGTFDVSYSFAGGANEISLLLSPTTQNKFNYRIRVSDPAQSYEAVFEFVISYFDLDGNYVSFSRRVKINYSPILNENMVSFFDGANKVSVVSVFDYITTGSDALSLSAKTISVGAVYGNSDFEVVSVEPAPAYKNIITVVWQNGSKTFSFVAGDIIPNRVIAQIIVKIKNEKTSFNKVLEVEITKKQVAVSNFTLTGENIKTASDGTQILSFSKDNFDTVLVGTSPNISSDNLVFEIKNQKLPSGIEAPHTLVSEIGGGVVLRHPNSAGTAELHVTLKAGYVLILQAFKENPNGTFEQLFQKSSTFITRVLYITMAGNVQYQPPGDSTETITETQNEAIINESDLLNIQRDVDYYLAANIYVTKQISISSYNGSFNGGGFGIYNLRNISASSKSGALFEVLESSGSIFNLKIIDAVLNINNAPQYAAILVGTNYGTISNIEIGATINVGSTLNAQFNAGGICGFNRGRILDIYNSSVTLNNFSLSVVNFGAVAGTSFQGFNNRSFESTTEIREDIHVFVNLGLNAGGNYGAIFGAAQSTLFISSVSLSFSLSGGNSTVNAGGIIGYSYGQINADSVQVSIGASGTNLNSIGGVAGTANSLIAANITVAFKKAVSNNAKYVGGIVGYCDVNNITNSGVFGFSAAVLNGTFAGGIAGSAGQLNLNNVIVNNIVLDGTNKGGFAGSIGHQIVVMQGQTYKIGETLYAVKQLAEGQSFDILSMGRIVSYQGNDLTNLLGIYFDLSDPVQFEEEFEDENGIYYQFRFADGATEFYKAYEEYDSTLDEYILVLYNGETVLGYVVSDSFNNYYLNTIGSNPLFIDKATLITDDETYIITYEDAEGYITQAEIGVSTNPNASEIVQSEHSVTGTAADFGITNSLAGLSVDRTDAPSLATLSEVPDASTVASFKAGQTIAKTVDAATAILVLNANSKTTIFNLNDFVDTQNTTTRIISGSEFASVFRSTFIAYGEGVVVVRFENTLNPLAFTELTFVLAKAHNFYISQTPNGNEIIGNINIVLGQEKNICINKIDSGFNIAPYSVYAVSSSSGIQIKNPTSETFSIVGIDSGVSATITVFEYFRFNGVDYAIAEKSFIATVAMNVESVATNLSSTKTNRNDIITATSTLTFTTSITEPAQWEIEDYLNIYLEETDFVFGVDAGINITSAVFAGNKLTIEYSLVFSRELIVPQKLTLCVSDAANKLSPSKFVIEVMPVYIDSIKLNLYNGENNFETKTLTPDLALETWGYLEIIPSKILNDETELLLTMPKIDGVSFSIVDTRGAKVAISDNRYTISLLEANGTRTLEPIVLKIQFSISAVKWVNDMFSTSFTVSSAKASSSVSVTLYSAGEYKISELDPYFAVGMENTFKVIDRDNNPVAPVLLNGKLNAFSGFFIEIGDQRFFMDMVTNGTSFRWTHDAFSIAYKGNGVYAFLTNADRELVGKTYIIGVYTTPSRPNAVPNINSKAYVTGVLYRITNVLINEISGIDYKLNKEILITFDIKTISAFDVADEIETLKTQMLTDWIKSGSGINLKTYDPASSGIATIRSDNLNKKYVNFKIVPLIQRDSSTNSDVIVGYSICGLNIGSEFSSIIVEATFNYVNGKPALAYNGTNITTNSTFEFKFFKFSSEEDPLPVYDETGLRTMNLANGGHYRLAANIYLTNHSAISEADFLTLDGNGYVIYVASFNTDAKNAQEGTLNLGVFSEIKGADPDNNKKEPSLVKNLTIGVYEPSSYDGYVNHPSSITVSDLSVKQVNYGTLAAINNGYVVNCEVVWFNLANGNSSVGLNSAINLAAPAETSVIFGGLVAVNGENGKISNSRVGRSAESDYKHIGYGLTSFATEDSAMPNNSDFSKIENGNTVNISASGTIGGLVGENAGFIASSYFANGQIINRSTVVETGTESSGGSALTGGLVAKNSGKISASYVEGIKNEGDSIVLTGGGISSSGLIGGFVYSNSGEIENCFANINLYTNAQSAGFVLDNKGGVVRQSYAFTNTQTTTNNLPFVGVEPFKQTFEGEIENCYYLKNGIRFEETINSTDGKDETFKNSDEVLLRLNEETAIVESNYVSFAFVDPSNGSNGIWEMKEGKAPRLVSADQIAVFNAYIETSEDNGEKSFRERSIKNFGDYVYIRTPSEFSEKIGHYESQNPYVQMKYRLISDIVFTGASDLTTTNIGTSLLNFKGILDGNGYSLKNVSVVAAAAHNSNNPLGIFSRITDNTSTLNGETVYTTAVVKNLNIEILIVDAGTVRHVGGLAGEIKNSTVIGINIYGAEKTGAADRRGEIYGGDIVGGIAGVVYGSSKLNSISSTISLSAGRILTTSSSDISSITENTSANTFTLAEGTSFAGGIIGAAVNSGAAQFYEAGKAQFKRLTVSGNNLTIQAVNVGGIFGFLGEGFLAHDLRFITPEFTETGDLYGTQKLSALYAAGGIVGELRGAVNFARLEAANQNLIDSYLYTDEGAPSQRLAGYKGLFNLRLQSIPTLNTYVGGIAGIVKGKIVGDEIVGGSITDCTSKVPVIVTFGANRLFNTDTSRKNYAGGIAGRAENASFNYSYTTSAVMANSAGGLVGKTAGEIAIDNVNVITNTNMSYGTDTELNNFTINKALMFKPVNFEGANLTANETLHYIGQTVNVITGGTKDLKIADFLAADYFKDFAKTGRWVWFYKDVKALPFAFYGISSHVKSITNQSGDDPWANVYDYPEALIFVENSFEINNTTYLDNKPFKGILMGRVDELGNKPTITVKVGGPLFSLLENATIINVDFVLESGTPIEPSGIAQSTYGFVARESRYSNLINVNVEIKNVEVNNNSAFVGGFVGNALFTGFENCTLKNSKITSNRNMSGGASEGALYLGGFVGFADSCTFTNCNVENSEITASQATAVGKTSTAYVGGLFGYSEKGTTVSGVSTSPTIYNVKVTSNLNGSFAGGLFGGGKVNSITGAVVKGASTGDMSEVTANAEASVAGGFVGNIVETNIMSGDSISGCFVTLTNVSSVTAGGFAGIINNAIIDLCYVSSGGVIGSGTAGGFVGLMNGSGKIDKSYSTVNVQSTASTGTAGGFVGELSSGTISYCYSKGFVNNAGTAGGFAGKNSGTIKNCFTQSNLAAVSSEDPANITNAGGFVGTNSGSVLNCYSTGNVNATNSGAGFAYQNSANQNNITNNFTLSRVFATNIGGFVYGGTANVNSNNKFAHELCPSHINSSNNGATRVNIETLTGEDKFVSNGVFEDIERESKRLIPHVVAASGQTFNNYDYYILSSNFTLSNSFGNFSSVLMGNGKTIKTSVNLFNELSNAVVSSLSINTSGATVTAHGMLANSATNTFIYCVDTEGQFAANGNNSGAIVGTLSNSVLESSRNNADINSSSALSDIGGLVGSTTNGSKILNCYNSGTVSVSASSNVGGLVGSSSNTTIKDSYNIGAIVANTVAGGLVGKLIEGSNIEYCYNTGLITANAAAGGLVSNGAGSTVKNAYNTGAINAPISQLNPLVYSGITIISALNVYYNSDLFEFLSNDVGAKNYINGAFTTNISFSGSSFATTAGTTKLIFPLLKNNGYFGVSSVGGIKTNNASGLLNSSDIQTGGQKNGIGANPLIISNSTANLNNFEDVKNASYYIENNITRKLTVTNLRGTFYGNNKQINEVQTNLFTNIENSVIANIIYTGCIVETTGLRFAGLVYSAKNSVICGTAVSSDNIVAATEVISTGSVQAAGGMAAIATNVSVYNSAVIETEITVQNQTGMSAIYGGMIFGSASGGQIINSYATGNIICQNDEAIVNLGGIAGSAKNLVVNNFVLKNSIKSGDSFALKSGKNGNYGAIFGSSQGATSLTNVSYNKETQFNFSACEAGTALIKAVGSGRAKGIKDTNKKTSEMYDYSGKTYKFEVPNKFTSKTKDGENLLNSIGTGSSISPKLVSNYNAFTSMATNEYYKIVDNIVATGTFTPKDTVKNLNGKGYAVYNILLESTDASGTAMFKELKSDHTIENISFENPKVSVIAQTTSGTQTALIVQNLNGGEIKNVAINGGQITVEQTTNNSTSTKGFGSIGAFAAVNSGTITSVYTTAEVRADGAETGSIGGIVGTNASAGIVSDSYASGIVAAMGFSGSKNDDVIYGSSISYGSIINGSMKANIGVDVGEGDVDNTVLYNSDLGNGRGIGVAFSGFGNTALSNNFAATHQNTTNYNSTSINAGMPILRGLLSFNQKLTNRFTTLGVNDDSATITNNDYLIDSLDDIKGDGTYRLVANINAGGANATAVTNFTGTIYGNGFVITNLTDPSTDTRAGLFETIGNGTLFDRLTFVNAKISARSSSAYDSGGVAAGVIAGEAKGGFTISNCQVLGGFVHASSSGNHTDSRKTTASLGESDIIKGKDYSGTDAFAAGFVGKNTGSANILACTAAISVYAKSGNATGQEVYLAGTTVNAWDYGSSIKYTVKEKATIWVIVLFVPVPIPVELNAGTYWIAPSIGPSSGYEAPEGNSIYDSKAYSVGMAYNQVATAISAVGGNATAGQVYTASFACKIDVTDSKSKAITKLIGQIGTAKGGAARGANSSATAYYPWSEGSMPVGGSVHSGSAKGGNAYINISDDNIINTSSNRSKFIYTNSKGEVTAYGGNATSGNAYAGNSESRKKDKTAYGGWAVIGSATAGEAAVQKVEITYTTVYIPFFGYHQISNKTTLKIADGSKGTATQPNGSAGTATNTKNSSNVVNGSVVKL